MTPKYLHLEMYGFDYYFFIQWPAEDFKKYALDNLQVKADADFKGETVFKKKRKLVVVWVSNNEPDWLSILVHECVHAASFTLNHIGVHADHDNDESLAYLAEHLWFKATENDLPH